MKFGCYYQEAEKIFSKRFIEKSISQIENCLNS